MNTKTLSFLLLFLPLTSFSQWEWGILGGNKAIFQSTHQYDNILEIETDPNGNVYILAQIGADDASVANQSLTTYSHTLGSPTSDLLVSSFTKDGNFRWSKVIGGYYTERGAGIKSDELGHIYVHGIIQNSHAAANPVQTAVHFDTDTTIPKIPFNPITQRHENAFNKVMFLVQYDTLGNFQWLSMPEPDTISPHYNWNHNSFPIDLDIDSTGNVYWFCSLRPGKFNWETDSIISYPRTYVVKYSPQGRQIGITSLGLSVGISSSLSPFSTKRTFFKRIHETGDYLVIGNYPPNSRNYLAIGQDTITAKVYMAYFSPTGKPLRKYLTGGVGNGEISGFEMDDSCNIYLSGYMQSGTSLGSYTYSVPMSEGSFISKFDTLCNQKWTRLAITRYSDWLNDVTLNNDEVAVIGTGGSWYWEGSTDTITAAPNHYLDAVISRFKKSNGNLITMEQTRSPASRASYGNTLCPGPQSTYYVGGNFNQSIYIGQDTLHKIGSNRSFFLAKYHCEVPESDFGYYGNVDSNSVTFYYDGGLADSVLWYIDQNHVSGDTVSHVFSTSGFYQICVQAFFECTDVITCDSVYVSSVDVNEKDLNPFKFYPNPTSGQIQFENLPTGSTIYLFNVNGQLVKEWRFENQNENFSIRELPEGVYFIKIESTDHHVIMDKLIKTD